MTIALKARLTLACSLLLTLFAVGCSVPDGEVVSEGEYLVFRPIALGQTGSFTETTEVVYRDATSWNAAKDSLTVVEPIREVDFDQTMVVLVAIPLEIGGYTIEVSSVEKIGGEIVVDYELAEPADDCIPIQGASLPFQVVTVTKTAGPVRFVRNVAPYKCTWRQDG